MISKNKPLSLERMSSGRKRGCMEKVTIDTGLGKVTGTKEKGVRIFRGIPFAVTERFELPKPYPAWEELDATGPETDCFQYSSYREETSFYYHEFREGWTFHYAESPMTLNIISPEKAEKLPVLVFIHGGGFETGNVGELPYGICTEYAKHGIVYVSLGHRLNVFSLYETGNYGLHDMVFGLRWVKEHIADYGGDPEQITIMGQSAGAMSIMDLLYTKTLYGIVKGAVTISGGGMVPKIARPYTKEEFAPFWANVRKRAGAATEEEFKMLPDSMIWDAWYEESRATDGFHVKQPGIDGVIIPKLPQDVAKEGSYLDIPMIMGITSQDFMPYLIFEMAMGWAKLHVKNGGAPVYGYMFDRALPGNRFKAFHAADLWYFCGNMDQCWRPFEKLDFDLKDEMIAYVANFVKRQDPNGAGLPSWAPISKKNKNFRLFDGVSDGMIRPMQCRKKLYHSFLKDKGPM